MPVEILGLELGVWRGLNRYIQAPWLRWYLPDGTLLPAALEIAQQAKARAEAEKARADELERQLGAQAPGAPETRRRPVSETE